MKVGIIGCGVIAPSHVESYNALKDIEVTAICDVLPDRMAKLSDRFPDGNFTHYSDASKLFADPSIDAVSICTDHASHEDLIIGAITAGKHLICEKALTTNSASLERIIQAGESTDLVTAGIFQHRFDPVYRVLKNLLSRGAIGQLLMISAQHQCWRPESYYTSDAWRGTWAGEGGSLLINQSIHFLDILQWVGGGVESVAAQIGNLGHKDVIETEDTVSISLKLKNGSLGTFAATSCSHREWESAFHVVGSDGDIHIRNGKLVTCSHRDTAQAARLEKQLGQLEELEGLEGAKDYYGSGHPAQIRDFVQAIRDNRPPFVSLADAAQTVALVLAAYESAKSGSVVQTVR